jgi:hypothetical protein
MSRRFVIPVALLLALSAGSVACSAPTEPGAFESANDLGSRLSADLGSPVYVEGSSERTFVAVQGPSRVIAAPSETETGAGVRDWVRSYATDLGADPDTLRVRGEARGPGGLVYVTLSSGLPENVDDMGFGVDVTLDAEGKLLGVVAHQAPRIDTNATISEAKAIELAQQETPRPAESDPATPPATDPSTEDGEPTYSTARVEPPSARLVLTTPTGEESARLAYLVELPNGTSWIDAHSGQLLGRLDPEASLQTKASGWRYYASIPFPKERKDRDVEYEAAGPGFSLSRPLQPPTFGSTAKSRIDVSYMAGFNNDGTYRFKRIKNQRPEAFDFDTPRYALRLPQTTVKPPKAYANGLGVDAMAEVSRADAFFQNNLLASPARRLRVVNGLPALIDDPIELVVHANHVDVADLANPFGKRTENAACLRGTTTILFGDGMAVYHPTTNANRSPLMSIDAVTHELTHMWLDARVQTGTEASMIEEALGDIVGQLVEHEMSVSTGWPSRPDRFAEESFVAGGVLGARNLAQPEVGEAKRATADEAHQANHWSGRTCLLRDSMGKPVLDARGQPQVDPRADMADCMYESASVIGHAFYLMTLGGKNATSRLVVRNPIGWSASQALWLGSIVKAPVGASLRALTPPTALDLAQRQVAVARTFSVDAANAVGCAWEAVGVLADGTTSKITGLACTKAGPISCAHRRDGVYCDEVSPFAAVRCQNGQIAASPPPCASGKVCRPQGLFVGNTAEMLTPNTLACHDPWD